MKARFGHRLSHLDDEHLVAYLADRLSYEDTLLADIHLADCQRCAQRVKASRAARTRFDQLWSSWTARQHAADFLRGRAATALGSVNPGSGLDTSLKAWIAEFSDQVEAALRIAFEAPARGAALIQSELGWLGDPDRARVFSPVPAAVVVHGDDRRQPWVTIESARSPWVRVTADPGAGLIRVRLQAHPEPWPLVLLIPASDDAASVREFRRVEGEDFLLAEFEDVGQDECLLVLQRTR